MDYHVGMIGPGKYDQFCTEVREKTKAEGAIIIVFGGELGSGMSCQAPVSLSLRLPEILRIAADEIERSASGQV